MAQNKQCALHSATISEKNGMLTSCDNETLVPDFVNFNNDNVMKLAKSVCLSMSRIRSPKQNFIVFAIRGKIYMLLVK